MEPQQSSRRRREAASDRSVGPAAARRRVAEQRAQVARVARRRSIVVGAAALAVTAAVSAGLAAVVMTSDDDGDGRRYTANVSVAPNVVSPIPGVVAYMAERGHIPGEIVYPQIPPVGGEHNERWLSCGIYDEPVADRNAVHSMEHGAIWITYGPALAPGQLEKLKVKARQDYMLLSPYEGMSSPITVTSWGMQLKVDSADDPRIDQFVTLYRNNRQTTPEYGASCDGGVMP